MGLSFHCPQCSQAVPALPTQMGQQVTCPGCRAEFRLSPILLGGNGRSAAAQGSPVSALSGTKSAAAPPGPPVPSAPAAAAPPIATVVRVPPRAAPHPSPAPPAAAPAALAPPQLQPASPAPPLAPGSATGRLPLAAPQPAAAYQPNVARFIAAVSQDSTVQLTADGKLPELSLAEATAKKQRTTESSTSPLVLGLVLSVSTLASILLLFADFSGSETDETSVQEARESIARYYASQSGRLLPYQVLLRQAQRAAERGDDAAERDAYRRVRDLLLSESKDPYAGVTGTQSGDDELARLLGILLDAEGR